MKEVEQTSKVLRDIKLSELLGFELKGNSKKVNDFLNDNLSDLTKYKISDISTLYLKGDIIMFEHVKDITFNINRIWCDVDNLWSFFTDVINLHEDESRNLILLSLKKILNDNNITQIQPFIFSKYTLEIIHSKTFFN